MSFVKVELGRPTSGGRVNFHTLCLLVACVVTAVDIIDYSVLAVHWLKENILLRDTIVSATSSVVVTI